jgi:hypothetical protein
MKKRAFGLTFIVVALVALQLAVAPPVMAAVIYSYTGNPYTTIEDSSLGTHMTASVTLDSVVPNNFTGFIGPSDIVSFSISSGPVTLTTGMTLFEFDFNNGVMTAWDLVATNNIYKFISLSNSQDATMLFNTENYNLVDSGTWTKVSSPSAAPIPGTVWLLGSGLVGLAVFRRKVRV